MMSERGFSPEMEKRELSDAEVAGMLKEKGFTDPEAIEELTKWSIRLEKEMGGTPEGQIDLEVRRARLYFTAGNKEAAIEAFKDAEEMAMYRYPERLDAIQAEIDAL